MATQTFFSDFFGTFAPISLAHIFSDGLVKNHQLLEDPKGSKWFSLRKRQNSRKRLRRFFGFFGITSTQMVRLNSRKAMLVYHQETNIFWLGKRRNRFTRVESW